MSYRFILEPYKGVATRHTCPQCKHKRCFSKYIDTEGDTKFPNHVGRCDREDNCGYHFTPKEYFEQNPDTRNALKNNDYSQKSLYVRSQSRDIPTDYVDSQIVDLTLTQYLQNNFYLFLVSQFGEDKALESMKQYRVGTSKHWRGATIFWQTDAQNRIRTGKIMLYNPETGKRVKQPHNHITWAHSLLKKNGFNLKQCFFGEHLLSVEPHRPIAIVESEKSALIASHYIPQYRWIASGGKNGCFNKESLQALNNRRVVLFPDLGAMDVWHQKSELMKSLGIEVLLFDYLEKNGTSEQREKGYDIADFLLEKKSSTAILEAMISKNPALKNLIEHFDLKLVEEEKQPPKVPLSFPKRKGFRV